VEENVENRLTHAIRGRAQAVRLRDTDGPSAMLAGDDS
jgi:hypothetical protein